MPQPQIRYFTDSLTVFRWFKRQSRSLKTFVSNRVSRAQRKILLDHLHYVPSKENPADLATKGIVPDELKESKLWFQGPEWLSSHTNIQFPPLPQLTKQEQEELDQQVQKEATTLEAMYATATPSGEVIFEEILDGVREEKHEIDSTSAETWPELWDVYLDSESGERSSVVPPTRASAAPTASRSPRLTRRPAADYHRARTFFIKRIQAESYRRTIDDLKKFKKASSLSRVKHLCPFLDSDGVLRSESRVRFAKNIAYNRRFPIILDSRHSITAKIVKHAHGETKHIGGISHTLSELSRFYVIPKVRNLVFKTIQRCKVCQQAKPRESVQKMGPLPEKRLGLGLAAFEHTAIDFTGAMLCTHGRRTTKVYGMLLTCMTTRAVHLEAVSDLSADALSTAFEAFLARKPRPKTITCDNATNFHRADVELKEFWQQLSNISTNYPLITWDFMPARSPHWGGVHERMIGLVKNGLKKILPDFQVSPLELSHFLAAVEGVLNRRPLCYVHHRGHEDEPLTPMHFLNGKGGENLVPISGDSKLPFGKRYKLLCQALKRFWKRFATEFVPTLHGTPKWRNKQTNFKEGDRVMLLDAASPVGEYPMGVVIKVFPGRDGLVRSAEVQLDNGKSKVRRHIRKFRLLRLPDAEEIETAEDY